VVEFGTSGQVDHASASSADIYLATCQILVAERQIVPAQMIEL